MRAAPETEAGFMGAVRQYARLRGWLVYHTYDSRRSAHGFPDLVLVRDGRIVFAELKAEHGRTSDAQHDWLAALGIAAARNPTVEAHLWRPSDWPTIEATLR